eukprot:scaffold12476_cov126-Isochrysis_galbana.AAC.2
MDELRAGALHMEYGTPPYGWPAREEACCLHNGQRGGGEHSAGPWQSSARLSVRACAQRLALSA